MLSKRNRRNKPKLPTFHFDSENIFTVNPTNYHTEAAINKFMQHSYRELDFINQDIYFRDLVLRVNEGYGEADYLKISYKYQQAANIRLKAHIDMIFKFAQEDHRANYCDETSYSTFQIKKGKENHITRLTTHEFNFYTKTPLTLSEYETLITDIQMMAARLEPNIHILLSSFAVIYKDNLIINVSIYVQGGNQPLLHIFCKNSSTQQDVNYNDKYKLFSQNNTISSEFISIDTNLIYTGSMIEITTFGGAKYLQAFDICNDLVFGHSQQQLERLLLNKDTINRLIPSQFEHCVSSYSINILPDKIIANNVLHVDPNVDMHKKKKFTFGKKIFDQDWITSIISNNNYATKIWDTRTGYYIDNPPFGRNYFIEVLAERPATKPANKYIKAIHAYNLNYINKRALNAIQTDLTTNDKMLQKLPIYSSGHTIFFYRNYMKPKDEVKNYSNVCNIF